MSNRFFDIEHKIQHCSKDQVVICVHWDHKITWLVGADNTVLSLLCVAVPAVGLSVQI